MIEARGAVVTGAAGGIGRAVVDLLGKQGVSVVAVDKDAQQLGDVRSVGPLRRVSADITTSDGRDSIVEVLDNLDYLINAAGAIIVEPLSEVCLEDWRATFAVNVDAVFFLTQQLLPLLREGGRLSTFRRLRQSWATLPTWPRIPPRKAAVLSVTRSFAFELAPRGIRVNAVCPGVVDTPMQTHIMDTRSRLRRVEAQDIRNARLDQIPLRRMARPAEVARVVEFLLSDNASYMTGQALNVTGGMVTW